MENFSINSTGNIQDISIAAVPLQNMPGMESGPPGITVSGEKKQESLITGCHETATFGL